MTIRRGMTIAIVAFWTVVFMVAAKPTKQHINRSFDGIIPVSGSLAEKSLMETKEKYNHDPKVAKARVQSQLTISPWSDEMVQVTGQMQLIVPGQPTYVMHIAKEEYLRQATVNGDLVYYGPITGYVKTIQKDEPFAVGFMYNYSQGKGLISMSTGTLENSISYLEFGDEAVRQLGMTLFRGE